ncbi:MAG: lipoyl(octanoyl) transferase LipB [Alphaproteobacteria bacterium]|nr:MAG: lipoyl(octanoyl) transferase LipB [Alphaproteobacteria bacterium]
MSTPLPLEWKISDEQVAYPDAIAFMEERVRQIRAGEAAEMVWCLEHPPLYTAGTSADVSDLVDPDRFPVYDAGRGGQYTYHGPGQRVVYFMLDLKARGRDVRQFVYSLEEVIIRTMAAFGVTAERRKGRVGVWVERGAGREDKIGAIGVRVRQWVTYHGIAINVEPNLEHFSGIVPCGISEHGVTSLADLGLPVTMDDVDVVLRDVFDDIFGLEARPMHLKVQDAPEGPTTKLPYEAMPTETGTVDVGADIAATHPVFRI